jgi:prepilin-type processing-associated H-X9-DG protein
VEQRVAARLAWLQRTRARRILAVFVVFAVIGAATGGVFAMRWQDLQWRKTACLSNMRRLGTALLLYSQDHDGRLPPPEYRTADGEWKPWTTTLRPYYDELRVLTCPANRAIGATNPYNGYDYPFGYALNRRFWGVFSAGPFPIENLEIAPQTVLLVEGGRCRRDGPLGVRTYPWALPWYEDTAWWPEIYPSPHNGRMNVSAADGHVDTVVVAHYKPEGHDQMYGRIGHEIFNWNGGHPNGDTGGPARE